MPPLRTIPTAVAALLLAAATGAFAVPLWFPGQVSVPVAAAVTSVVSADVNGDGRIELIVGRQDGRVDVLRPLPGSQFGTLASLEIGGNVLELAALPAGPSGLPELIALTVNPDRAVLLRWTGGDSPLQDYAALDLEEDPLGLAVGLAPDGDARRCGVTLPGIDTWLLLGETPAGWAVLQRNDTGDRPVAVVALDLDADGTPELITADNGVLSRGLTVFRRGAGGAYAPDQRLATPGSPSALRPFDADRDGTPELYVAYADSSYVSRYDPAGGALLPGPVIRTPLPASGLNLAYLNATEVGLWSWHADRGTVSYLRNAGAGWIFIETYYAGGRAIDAQMSDLNQDLYPDLVVANGASKNLGLLYGNNLRRFRGYLVTPLPGQPVATQLRDEDGDGQLDYLVACYGSRTVELLRGDGHGHLAAGAAPLVFDRGPLAMASLRADGDALTDLAVTLPDVNRVALRRRLPGGGYAALPDLVTGAYPGDICAGDLDGDGHDDLAVADIVANAITLAFGAGDGTFPDVRTLSPGVPVQNLILADLNRDRLPDIVADNNDTYLYTMLNLGGREFQTPQFYLITGQPADLAGADFDGDGDQDVLVARGGAESLGVYENLGNGWLAARSLAIYLGGRPGTVAAADVDMDGRVDFVSTVADQQRVAIFLNSGLWRFSNAISFVSALSPGGIAIGDLNGDDVPDFALLDQSLNLAMSMLNVPPNPVPIAPAPLAAACVDGAPELTLDVDGAAGWRLEGAASTGWALLATEAGASHGELRRDGATLRLRLEAADRAAAGLAADAAGRFVFRLSDATGAALALASIAPCAAAAAGAGPFELLPARPNPGNPGTAVRFRLSRPTRVSAAVVDAAGRRIARLGTAAYAAGEHALRWDGRAEGGGPAGSGVYLIVVSAEGRTLSRRVTLVR